MENAKRFDQPERAVEERTTLLSRDERVVICVRLPSKKIRECKLPEEFGGTPYLKYSYMVPKDGGGFGHVNHHLYTPAKAESVAGEDIFAVLEIEQKKLEDGKEFLYINLYPTKVSDTDEVYWVSAGDASELSPQHGWRTFYTPGDLNGVIVVTPRGKFAFPKRRHANKVRNAKKAPASKTATPKKVGRGGRPVLSLKSKKK